MVQVMARQLVRAIKVRKLVLAHQDQVLKVVRCHYTDVCQREVSRTAIQKRFENDTVVTVETLLETGIVKNPRDGVKILGNGELTKKLTVKVDAFSEGAKAKIEAVGGTCEVI